MHLSQLPRPGAAVIPWGVFLWSVLPPGVCVVVAGDPPGTHLAVPIAGEPFPARLVEIASDWTITLDSRGTAREIGAADLVRWGRFREDIAASQVLLRDGSIFVADVMRVDDTSITLESAFWPTTTILREQLAGIIFSPPPRRRPYDRIFQSIIGNDRASDVVRLRNGDQIAGQLSAAPGRVAQGDDFGLRRFGVTLRADRPPIAVAVDDTVAVMLRAEPRTRRLPARATWLGFQDGSLLSVGAMEATAATVRLTLSCGPLITLPPEALWNDIRLIQPLGTATRYLSDLSPLGYQHSPFLELERPLGIDRNVLDGQMRAGGDVHLKGLGMATTSRVLYEVTAGDRRFAAELALDDAAGNRGSAVYRVFLEKPREDQSTSWDAAYTSPVVRGGDAPRPITLDLGTATKIALIVDFADHGDARDYANWLHARFLP